MFAKGYEDISNVTVAQDDSKNIENQREAVGRTY